MDAYATQSRCPQDQALYRTRRPAFPAAFAALAAAMIAVAIQSFWIPIDADISWMITVCERVLSGDRLYIDILEVNPPASVWLYMPFVWLAKAIGARPEAVIAGAFIVGGLASVAATLRLASRLDDAPGPAWLSAALAFVALVLPMALFAQREHAALLLALPALAAMALIAEGKPLDRRESLASGLAAGLVIVIKPYFLLAILAPALWAARRRRSLIPVLPAAAAGAAVLATYALAVLVFESAYFDRLSLLTETYGRVHAALWKVFVGPSIFPAICLALAILLRAPRVPALATAWGLGSAGFVISAIAQAKNYPNHWLPGAALALAAVFVLLASPGITTARRRWIGASLAVLAAYEVQTWVILPDPAVAMALVRVAPPSPSIIALSPELTTGHPLTRNVNGTWAGSSAGLYTAAAARFAGLNRPAVMKAYRDDIRSFANDVERRAPDVVLVDVPSKKWLMREPAVVHAMSGYRPAARAGDTEIWIRRNPRV
jgi:hypothetical protein